MYLSIRFGFVWAFKLVQMEHLYKFCQILIMWSCGLISTFEDS